jgi:diguanylate cyclase (GGDEF)-like protein
MITNMVEAIAYLAMASALNDLFIATEESVLGRRFKVILAVLLAGSALQTGIIIATGMEWEKVLAMLQLGAAFCLGAVPVVFWPVVARIKRGQMRILNSRLTERARRAEAQVAGAHKWLQLAEQSGHVGHWQLTVPDNRLIWSDEIYRIHGLWHEHYKPRIETALAAFHPADAKRVGAMLQEAVTSRNPFEIACRLRRPDGEIRHVIMRGVAQMCWNGRVEALNGVMVDVTEPKRAEARILAHTNIRGMAQEDHLTGLADRQQFDASLGYEFKRAVRSRKPLGMVLLEIDHYRSFTAHYGMLEGDACLRAVAQAVQAMPRRTGDVVARYGDTEIAILLPLADAAGALRVGTLVAEAIRALGLPHAGHDSGVLSVSIGAAAFVGMDDLYNPLELTRRAEQALLDAEAAGGNQVRGFHAAGLLEVLGQH